MPVNLKKKNFGRPEEKGAPPGLARAAARRLGTPSVGSGVKRGFGRMSGGGGMASANTPASIARGVVPPSRGAAPVASPVAPPVTKNSLPSGLLPNKGFKKK